MSTTDRIQPTHDRPSESARQRPLWWTGCAAGVLGAVATMASSPSVPVASRQSDASAALVRGFDGLDAKMRLSSAVGLTAVALLLVFVSELRRRLSSQEPTWSAVPLVAWAGGIAASAGLAVAFVVAAITGTLAQDGYRDTTLEVFSALGDNLAFGAWVPLGVTTGAIAVGSLRHGSLARWIGAVSAGATVLLLAAVLVGLPFASWLIACVWLVAAGIAVAQIETDPTASVIADR